MDYFRLHDKGNVVGSVSPDYAVNPVSNLAYPDGDFDVDEEDLGLEYMLRDSDLSECHFHPSVLPVINCANADSMQDYSSVVGDTNGYSDLRVNLDHLNQGADYVEKTETPSLATSPNGRPIKVFPECVSGTCDCVYMLEGVVSQLKPCRFASIILTNDLLREKYTDLLGLITDGFPVVDSPVQAYECVNYSSITDPAVKPMMDKIIEKELQEGVISFSETKPTCIHSLGAVPKPDGSIRPITDCSRPLNVSVNNHCTSLVSKFSFKSVADVTAILNQNDFMTVVDIKSAYRAVPIDPAHRKYQGFIWEWGGKNRFFVDNRLCFGLSLGPMHFNLLSNFIHDVLSVKYSMQVVNYLDDFIAISSDHASCVCAEMNIVKLLRFLGFHISYSKLVPPSRCVTFLGIVIDSEKMELRLPHGKVDKLKKLLDSLLVKTRVSKKELESLGGILAHCSQVIRCGRVFCKRIYALYRILVSSKAKFVTMPDWVKGDLRWWRKLIDNFNGSSKILYKHYEIPMISDSSLKGFAVYLGCDWVAGTWDDSDFIDLVSSCNHIASRPFVDYFDPNNINVLELWPIVVGLKRWCKLFRNTSLSVVTDNTQVMYMLINGGSSNSTCMNWVREIFWICAIYNIEMVPRYINTKDNVIADTLSRIPYYNDKLLLSNDLQSSDLCCLNLLCG